MKKLFFILLLISLLSCNIETEIVKVSSTGKLNSVLVVVDNDKWDGEVGDIIKDVLGESLVGLPQEEYRYSLTQVSSHNFNKMLRPSRNIISISFSDKNSFSFLKDKYAEPQRVIIIHAKDKENLVQILQKKEDEIIQIFKESDIKSKQNLLLEKYWDASKVNTFTNQKIAIKIPYAYRKVQDTLDYIWFRKDIPKGYLNLQAYTIPLSSEVKFTKEGIIAIRNQKGAEFIPGEKEGSHVTTEDKVAPTQYNKTMLGLKMIETRGLWTMKEGYMGGPFLSYALLDTKNNRIIVAEGFVYAPNVAKRDYLFELEALLKTLEI